MGQTAPNLIDRNFRAERPNEKWVTLIQASRDWWDEHVEDEPYPATAEGLAQFISETLEPICVRMRQEARLVTGTSPPEYC